MKRHRSAEDHVAALEAILDRWRANEYRTEFYRQIAVAEIKALGFTEGDAERYLSSAVKRPAKPA